MTKSQPSWFTVNESTVNSKSRIFKLGSERVPEKCEYDHLCVKTCLFDDSETRVKDKISKGRKTLNAASGLGIKRNELTVISCNLFFGAVVLPIVSFGCKLWTLSEPDKENLMSFQRNTGRWIQEFRKRSLSNNS